MGLLFVLCSQPILGNPVAPSVLKTFVDQPDGHFRFGKPQTSTKDPHGGTFFYGSFTSQQWQPTAGVQPAIWEHQLHVYVPKVVTLGKQIFVYLGGGRRDQPKPIGGMTPFLLQLARRAGIIVAELQQLPPQPLSFGPADSPRFEDQIIAYGWDRFLATSDQKWIVRLPMLKAASRSLTVVHRWLRDARVPHQPRFVVAGASKRGWVSWLIPLVDSRVVGIVPVVIDLLNLRASMRHHHETYGGWSPVLKDYVEHRITGRLDTPAFRKLMDLIDPVRYVEQLSLPKLVITAANDQFFLPDSARFYFDKLRGPSFLRVVANTGHYISDPRPQFFTDSLAAFVSSIEHRAALPTLVATEESSRRVRFQVVGRPKVVRLWQASNPAGYDFRAMQQDFPKYLSSVMTPDKDGAYSLALAPPNKGCVARFLAPEYDVSGFHWNPTSRVFVTCAKKQY